ncbi:MAG: Nramp family divalent metal transporter [Pseudomonadota bacterium]
MIRKLTLGPGTLVAAAFIGPGTVTACTLAGAQFGFALLWTLVFATVATMILQEMAARLGAGAERGLGDALMEVIPSPALKVAAGALVFAAIVIGNAAYEAGNITGGVLGLEALLGAHVSRVFLVLGLAILAGGILLRGRYKTIETFLIGLVLLMAIAFAGAAILVRPDLSAMVGGLRPQVPEGATLSVLALIGTTIVPYNLFLHAAAAKQRWPGGDNVEEARADTLVSVGIGGLVSILILTSAASTLFVQGIEVSSAADMARGLEPIAGPAAKYLIAIGLLAAGLTSAITAPLATGYALSEILPLQNEQTKKRCLRATALTILGIGTVVSLTGIRPLSLILIAQAANGILLPVVVAFLLYVMNSNRLLGLYKNGLASNILGSLVLVFALGLGSRGLLRAFGVEL